MRVALVTYGFLMGGVEKFLFMLGDGLRSRGIDVTYVVTEEIGPWHQLAMRRGIKIISILPSPWQSYRQHAARLTPILADFDAILLSHCPAAQAIMGELPASCLVISILHNDQEMVYRIGLSNLARTDYIVAVGSKILSEATRRGAPAEKSVRIPYGIEVPSTYPKARNAGSHHPLKIIFVGRILNEQKGVFDIPAILQTAKRLGATATLDIVGDGEQDETELRRMFTSELPDLPVTFHGRKDNDEAVRMLREADVLLMPSRFEGLPVALLEALAQAAVPVASRLPGVTDDAVTDGVNGILPAVGDIEGFARAIVTLRDDDVLRRMSYAAWETARREFTQDVMTSRYLELLNRPRPQRDAKVDPPDAIGRKLFGRSWYFPVAVTQAVRAFRKRQLLDVSVAGR